MSEPEQRGKAALRLAFTSRGLTLAVDPRTDESVLLNRATIAVASSMTALTLFTERDEQRRTEVGLAPDRASLASVWTMVPSQADFQQARELIAAFHLTALEALEIASASRLAPDGFILVGASGPGLVAARHLGLSVHASRTDALEHLDKYFPELNLKREYPGGLRQVRRELKWMEVARLKARRKAAQAAAREPIAAE
jgi:hypothetical protein